MATGRAGWAAGWTIALCCLGAAAARAQGSLSAPAGYRLGWQVEVRKAGDGLERPEGGGLASFAAPAAGFDMGSYRDAAPNRFDCGLAYDAQGFVNAPMAGRYTIGTAVAWTAAPDQAEAHCALKLAVDGKVLADWQGPVTADADRRTPQGEITLDPGPHPADLAVSCDQPLGARLAVTVMIKAPTDGNLHPAGPVDIVHIGPGSTPAAAMAAAPAATPMPSPQPAPPPLSAPQPVADAGALVATIDLTIRDRPDRRARPIGRLVVGQAVTVAGSAPDPAWVELAQGGYVEAGYLKPAGEAGPARPLPVGTRAR